MVTTYWEMVASFVTSGVLNQELFFQSGRELLLVWERMGAILPALKEKNSDAFAYTNLETVAQAYIAYLDRRSPGTGTQRSRHGSATASPPDRDGAKARK